MTHDAPASLTADATRFLLSLPGVVAAADVPPEAVAAARDAEDRYERDAILPVRNLAMRHGLARAHVLAILKDSTFRAPPVPTLYLVEVGEAASSESLMVDGTRYRILGEECRRDQAASEGSLRVSDTFVLYPDRRTNTRRPACFLLPPVPFPELQGESWSRRVRGVVSASPSSEADVVIRGACHFAQDPRLGSLILGFDPWST